jgi:hypothetical protein
VLNFGGGDFRPYYDWAPSLGTWTYPANAPPAFPPPPPPPPPAGDRVAPNTRLVGGPTARTSARAATFRFVSTEARSRFQCKLDRRAWGACRSPKTYRSLARGRHTFLVRAIDRAGNVDRTPARKAWRIG